MHLFKCNLKELKEEVDRLNQKVKRLERHVDVLNREYFLHHVDKKKTRDNKCQCYNDLDWRLKFYNYE